MASKKTLCRVASGAFVRNIGWKRTASGYAQHKFHLGRDEAKATLANLRLEQLWREVVGRWERENFDQLSPTDRPVWDEVTLAVAEAVRKGERVARVPLPVSYSAMVPESPRRGLAGPPAERHHRHKGRTPGRGGGRSRRQPPPEAGSATRGHGPADAT